MHKYLRAAGFSMYQKNRDIKALLKCLSKEPKDSRCIQIDRDTDFYELRAEIADGIGISMCGEMNEQNELEIEYYYPYLESSIETSTAECSIQRHTEKETYAGLLDEYRVGISLIFYVTNGMEYRERILKRRKSTEVVSSNLAGFSVHGKILLPVKKTENQIAMAKVASRNRNNLREAAKNGDPEAMESLTIEDIDLYSQASRRAAKEDLYTIIDTCFMPSGIECDQYSIIGEIEEILLKKNRITGEELYDMKLECNDIHFRVCINKADLFGEPKVGRRFKGKVWMQGRVFFDEALG